jgi:hypothetical protein
MGDRYTQIKKLLAEAARHVEAGNLDAADATVRAAIPLGMTRSDMDANLPRATIRKLRKHTAKR